VSAPTLQSLQSCSAIRHVCLFLLYFPQQACATRALVVCRLQQGQQTATGPGPAQQQQSVSQLQPSDPAAINIQASSGGTDSASWTGSGSSSDSDSDSDYGDEGTAEQQRAKRQHLATSRTGPRAMHAVAAAAGRAAGAGNNSHQASHMNASTSAARAAGASVPTGSAANNLRPLSLRYLRCQGLFRGSGTPLCKEFCQGLQPGTQLQLHVSVHDADWDPDQYMADLAAAQGQQGAPANLTEVSSNTKALYNCQAVAGVYKHGNTQGYCISQLLHDRKLDAYLGCSPPYDVVLQEKVRQQQARHEQVGPQPSNGTA